MELLVHAYFQLQFPNTYNDYERFLKWLVSHKQKEEMADHSIVGTSSIQESCQDLRGQTIVRTKVCFEIFVL